MHPFVLSETLVVSLLLQGELSIFPVGIHLSVFSCSWPLNFSFSVWIFRVGMLLSGSFRTLKEKMYLSVTFTNSGNSSLCFPLQLCHAVFTLRMPLFFPFKTTNSCKMLCACMRHILLSAHLSAHAGLQFHSDDYFSRLRLINHWGLSAYLDPRQSVLISSGRFCWVFTPHRLSHLWSACCGSSGRQWTDAKADVGPHPLTISPVRASVENTEKALLSRGCVDIMKPTYFTYLDIILLLRMSFCSSCHVFTGAADKECRW